MTSSLRVKIDAKKNASLDKNCQFEGFCKLCVQVKNFRVEKKEIRLKKVVLVKLLVFVKLLCIDISMDKSVLRSLCAQLKVVRLCTFFCCTQSIAFLPYVDFLLYNAFFFGNCFLCLLRYDFND